MSSFRLDDERPLPALDLVARHYQHPSGASHIHLACADQHRSCLIGFRTPPTDDSGLPHALEHLTLCGSERYPVRDPFFHMLRRSLQTFMNAMTGPDATWYPFATCHPGDFANLYAVYLDAVYHPLLDPRDFRQETCRLRWDGQQAAYAGVVHNEMLGAMADPEEQLYHHCLQQVFPQTCFARNSGGDPLATPTLTRDRLAAFHQRCYRLGNTCLVTYGDLNVERLQDQLLAQAVDGTSLPPAAGQLSLPQPGDHLVPVDAESDHDRCWLAWPWALAPDPASEYLHNLLGNLLDELLIAHPACPLRAALEHSGTCSSIAGSGFHDYLRNGLFVINGHGVAADQRDAFRDCCHARLDRLRHDGPKADDLAIALHQLELQSRRISGDRTPFGLQLCEQAFSAWSLGRSALDAIDDDRAMAALRASFGTPDAIAEAIDRHLTADACHRLSTTPEPVSRQEQLRAQASAAWEALDPERQQAEIAAEAELDAWQQRDDDADCLPDLAIADIPAARFWPQATSDQHGQRYRCASNGIGQIIIATRLEQVDDRQADLLPILAFCIGRLGLEGQDHAAWEREIHRRAGGLAAWCEWPPGDDALFLVEVWGLSAAATDLADLLQRCLHHQIFSEHERLRELLRELLQLECDDLPNRGVDEAEAQALRAFPGNSGRTHRRLGIGRIHTLQALLDDLPGCAEALAQLFAHLRSGAQWQRCCIGDDPETIASAAARIDLRLTAATSAQPSTAAPSCTPAAPTAILLPSGLASNAVCLPAPRIGHPDAPALVLAAQILSDHLLHPLIREQGGAYGCGASYRAASGIFSCTSDRDPHIDQTLQAIDRCLADLAATPVDAGILHEARLSAIASLDRPLSPSSECRSHWIDQLRGTTTDAIDALRRAILTCEAGAISAAVARHLLPAPRSLAVAAPEHLLTLATMVNAETAVRPPARH